jgi:hypothetical protein
MPATGAMVELLLGSTWTDVTQYVYHRDRIKITRGRQDEGATVQPSSCTLTVNNKGGRFSPRVATGPYFGQIGHNTPLRVSVAAGTPFLNHPPSGTDRRVSTPSTAALQITGDLDVRWDLECPDWTPSSGAVELGGKWGAAGQRAWRALTILDALQFHWTTDGTTEITASQSLSTAVHSRRLCVRITADVNNGSGGRDIAFYTGPTLNGPWTQVGSTQTFTGTSATASSTAPVEIGDVSTTGSAHVQARIYAAQIRSGIGGPIVANPDFTDQAPGALTFTDSAGVPWTANAADAITNRRVRFVGEVSEWPSRWDPSGSDVYVPVQAAGIMRRLAQGESPLDSTLRRRVAADASVVAYWPMEDGSGAVQAYSPLPGVQPMPVSGAQMASDASLAGSLALPSWPQGSHFGGAVPSFTSASGWQVQCVFRCDSTPTSLTNLLIITSTGTIRRWEIAVAVGQARIRGYDASGTLAVDSVWSPLEVAGPWTRLQFSCTQSGGTVQWQAIFLVVGAAGLAPNGTLTGTVGSVSDVHQTYIASIDNLRLGHVAVFSDPTDSAFNQADTGFDGDTVDARMTRLAGEEGVPLLTPYGLAGTELMGPQGAQTVLSLLQEAATADVGILYEHREQVALAARPRQSLYNQTPTLALDYAARGEVAPPLEPQEDDQATRNDVTRSRPNGSSARVTLDAGPLSTLAPPNGVGRYTDSQTVNVHSDDQLPHQAGWWLHLGTWDEARYPQVTVNLAAGPWLSTDAAEVDLGDLITIDNPPAWLPPDLIRLIAQGYTETIGWADWTITYNCTPGGPWVVGVLDDPVLGRLDTAGARLAAAVSASATTLSVETTSGPLWITTAGRPGDFPFDVRIAGEVVTVTAISGTSSPQSFTVTRATNGVSKAQALHADVRLDTPLILAL